MVSTALSIALLGLGTAPGEIVVQVYPKVQYLPADQILSESGLGMTTWAQGIQRIPSQISTRTANPGPRTGFRCNRRLKIAYVWIAATEASHTAGKRPDVQTGAITIESQADARRHENWHIDVARGAAAKANELEAILIALTVTGWNGTICDAEGLAGEAAARIEELVMRRYHQLRDKYNARLHEISSAGVVNGVWCDNQSGDGPSAVIDLLAELNAEPPGDGMETPLDRPQVN